MAFYLAFALAGIGSVAARGAKLGWVRSAWVAAIMLFPAYSSAHLMMPQRGTLNFVDGGAYMVISLPVTAFPYTRDSAAPGASTPHLLSLPGYTTHRQRIAADVEAKVQLFDERGPLKLEGTFVNFAPPDDDPRGAAAHIVVLGRYALRSPDDAHRAALRWKIGLFGTGADEQKITTTVTRANSQTGQKERQLLVFAPESNERALFPSATAVLVDYLWLGVEHILTGFDHLLFLLIVLAASRGWRSVVVALTCFTAGHAATLTLSLVGGINLPSQIVEPSIALTIVFVALYDLWAQRQKFLMPTSLRLAIVFACALIHGLGLAASLEARGLDREHLVQSMVGFNLGVEAGQLLVSAVFAVVVVGIARAGGATAVARARMVAGVVAVIVGAAWFVQRIAL